MLTGPRVEKKKVERPGVGRLRGPKKKSNGRPRGTQNSNQRRDGGGRGKKRRQMVGVK